MTTIQSTPAPRASHPTRDSETFAALLDPHMDGRIRRILQHLDAAGLRLATAESCTGGLLASVFTDVNGVSHVFERGLITYDTDVKVDLLGVPRALIDAHGVVSAPVVIAMAEGLVTTCGEAAVGVAVTGYAGSGPEPGLVHIGLARPGRATVQRAQRFGAVGRGAARLGTVRAVIALLEEHL